MFVFLNVVYCSVSKDVVTDVFHYFLCLYCCKASVLVVFWPMWSLFDGGIGEDLQQLLASVMTSSFTIAAMLGLMGHHVIRRFLLQILRNIQRTQAKQELNTRKTNKNLLYID